MEQPVAWAITKPNGDIIQVSKFDGWLVDAVMMLGDEPVAWVISTPNRAVIHAEKQDGWSIRLITSDETIQMSLFTEDQSC